MLPQPSTLYPLHTQQQPFTLIDEHEAWHVTFPGHRCELDVHGSRIEAQAIARCYYSLFLAPGAPFAHAGLSECEKLDLAEREAAIEIEVQQRRLGALLYVPSGDGALASVRSLPRLPLPSPSRCIGINRDIGVEEPPARYRAGGTSPRLAAALIGDQLTNHLSALFDLMGIAEDEISAAMVRHPDHARLLWNGFQFLAPGMLEHYDSRLYRSHCREILERVASAGAFIFQKRHEKPLAINRPTAAESLAGVSQASFVAPMHGEGSLVFHLLFARVYGPASPWPIVITHDETNRLQCEVRHADVTVRLYEDFEDQAEDLIDDVRRFLFNKGITSDRDAAKSRDLRDIPDHYAPPTPQLRLFAAA